MKIPKAPKVPKAHLGFKAVQSKIAKNIVPQKPGQTKQEAAGAILASAARKASSKAKAANPNLKHIITKKKSKSKASTY